MTEHTKEQDDGSYREPVIAGRWWVLPSEPAKPEPREDRAISRHVNDYDRETVDSANLILDAAGVDPAARMDTRVSYLVTSMKEYKRLWEEACGGSSAGGEAKAEIAKLKERVAELEFERDGIDAKCRAAALDAAKWYDACKQMEARLSHQDNAEKDVRTDVRDWAETFADFVAENPTEADRALAAMYGVLIAEERRMGSKGGEQIQEALDALS